MIIVVGENGAGWETLRARAGAEVGEVRFCSASGLMAVLASAVEEVIIVAAETVASTDWLLRLRDAARLPRVGAVAAWSVAAVEAGAKVSSAPALDSLVAELGSLPATCPSRAPESPLLYLSAPVVQLLADRARSVKALLTSAEAMGFSSVRASRVWCSGSGVMLERNERDFIVPAYRAAVGAPLRVLLDFRHLALFAIGTSVYARQLALGLASRSDISLTLLVRDARQAEGLASPAVFDADGDYDLIHKPAQVFDLEELPLLMRAAGRLVVTQLDMIAYRSTAVFASPAEAERYQATTALALSAASRVVTLSQAAREDILAATGVDADVTLLGVDAALWSSPAPAVPGVDGPFFLAVSSDYPHKNLEQLFAAHAALGPSAPKLVLVGQRMAPRALAEAPGVVKLLGASEEALRWLYQNALALVFVSTYEGFGLPVLEAMAAGCPVVCLRESSLPEVAGDAAFYVEPAATTALVAALQRLASDSGLRETLRTRGREHAKKFPWSTDALVTSYRQAALAPRALPFREALRALPDVLHGPAPEVLGIKGSAKQLWEAVKRRIER